MSWLESYQEGHYAPQYLGGGVLPPWAATLGWTDEGLWAVVQLSDLKAAIPKLEIFSPTGRPACVAILPPLQSSNQRPEVFRQMENTGLALLSLDPEVVLESTGGLITRGLFGETEFVGDMWLTSPAGEGLEARRFKLPRRMHITPAPGSASVGGGPEVVPPFRVKTRLTCFPEELTPAGAPVGLADDLLSTDMPVFLYHDTTPHVTAGSALPPAPLPRTRRPSLGSRVMKALHLRPPSGGGGG